MSAGRPAGRLPHAGAPDMHGGAEFSGDGSRPSRGQYMTRARVDQLRQELTQRDLEIITTLGRFTVATALQLERLHFDAVAEGSRGRRRRDVLARLVRVGVLVRLPRRIGGVRAGSTGYIYALDLAGQKLIGDSAPRRPITPAWPGLLHALELTQLYVETIEAQRDGRLRLERFVPEPHCWPLMASEVRPDGVVSVLTSVGSREHWAVEIDRGTERPARLRQKLLSYWRAFETGSGLVDVDVFPWVLLVGPDERRLGEALRVIERLPLGAEELVVPVLAETAVQTLAAGGPS